MIYTIGAVPNLLRYFILLGYAATLNAQSLVESEHTRHIKSKHSVAITVERAKRIAEHSELNVFGVIDYTQIAAAADLERLPAQLMVFGDPAVDTELMNANPLIGLDLPLKLLVWEDHSGVVWISYSSAEAMQKRHKLSAYTEQFNKIEYLLKDLAQQAGQ